MQARKWTMIQTVAERLLDSGTGRAERVVRRIFRGEFSLIIHI